MAIWRGTGGSGESSSDSTINITTALAIQAAASAAENVLGVYGFISKAD